MIFLTLWTIKNAAGVDVLAATEGAEALLECDECPCVAGTLSFCHMCIGTDTNRYEITFTGVGDDISLITGLPRCTECDDFNDLLIVTRPTFFQGTECVWEAAGGLPCSDPAVVTGTFGTVGKVRVVGGSQRFAHYLWAVLHSNQNAHASNWIRFADEDVPNCGEALEVPPNAANFRDRPVKTCEWSNATATIRGFNVN